MSSWQDPGDPGTLRKVPAAQKTKVLLKESGGFDTKKLLSQKLSFWFQKIKALISSNMYLVLK